VADTQEHCKRYSKALESSGQMKLIIWPGMRILATMCITELNHVNINLEHCLIGRPGHCVQRDVYEATKIWESAVEYQRCVYYVYKGFNNLTEMYSAIRAEVPIENDPSTQTNEELLQYLWQASKVIICGQARSHCVNYTVRDIVLDWQSRVDVSEHRKELSRIVLLDDGKLLCK
jgi:nicotinamidase/pyrazinamidase